MYAVINAADLLQVMVINVSKLRALNYFPFERKKEKKIVCSLLYNIYVDIENPDLWLEANTAEAGRTHSF